MKPKKPESMEELKALHDAGEIDIMLMESLADGRTAVLVCDTRQPYKGEIYELIL